MCARGAAWLLLLAAAGAGAVDVLRYMVPFESDYTATVDNTVEYILEFVPTAEQAMWPARIQLAASGGETERPILLTARQTTGAQTWQLPFQVSDAGPLLFQLQRTLCFRVSESSMSTTEQFSLHISSANNASLRVSARVDPARDWLLTFGDTSEVHITQMSARVYYYPFAEEQSAVRLVVASKDDVCSVIAIQDYSCPVAETLETVTGSTAVTMTVQRSGGAHISRSRFPKGFYVVAVVQATDEPCTGEVEAPPSDWLFEAALDQYEATTGAPAAVERSKLLTLTIQPALSRAQYAVACVVTLVVFLGFYVVFLTLVFVQRFQPVKRLVGPKAVLADARGNDSSEAGLSPERRRRRGSDATFDSVDDDSSSDEESRAERAGGTVIPPQPTTPAPQLPASRAGTEPRSPANGDTTLMPGNGAAQSPSQPSTQPASQTQAPTTGAAPSPSQADTQPATPAAPFGLPARLNVAALSRRAERTLRVRANRYLHTLYTVSVFYALPVVQFVAAFQLFLNVSGSLDVCYYNFLCAHPAGALSDFNHVYSNLGYLLLGALFMLQVRRRRRRRKRSPRHEEYGIPAHYGLYSSLGAGMMVVGLLSACYHVCPNQLNFQFDTAFMYVLAVLAMVKLYQSRHPDINARAHSTFGVLAVLIALVVWGVLSGNELFWGVFTVLHLFTFLVISMRIYYVGQFRLDGQGLAVAARSLRELPASRPLYMSRLVALWLANAVNWAFALYGLVTMSTEFASHLLFLLLGNVLLYMVFYLSMKLAAGERLRWYSWCYLAGAALVWAPAMYFFMSGSSSWSATPAQSRHLNHECRVLQFYDAHDLWHMLSAIALYLTFNAMLTWDDGLSAVKRTHIAVF